MFSIHHHHVGRQSVRKGADLARGATGRRLTGQRKGAVTGLRLLAQQEMIGIGLLVDPGAAHVLVEAHCPEGNHLAAVLDVEIGELLQLLLEIGQRFVGIAFGKLGDEIEGVRLDTLLEILEGDQPVLDRFLGVFLLDLLAGLAPLRPYCAPR